jgi:two-component system, cell cycle response regulator
VAMDDDLSGPAADRGAARWRRAVAHALAGAVRPGDVVGRRGGDESAVILRRTEPQELAAAGGRAIGAVRAVTLETPALPGVTVSGGAAACKGASVEPVIAAADQALYRAKSAGRDRLDSAERA